MAAPQRRRPGRPSAAASAETRERILRAACARFALSGYDRARNQEAAGVTSAALHAMLGLPLRGEAHATPR